MHLTVKVTNQGLEQSEALAHKKKNDSSGNCCRFQFWVRAQKWKLFPVMDGFQFWACTPVLVEKFRLSL